MGNQMNRGLCARSNCTDEQRGCLPDWAGALFSSAEELNSLRRHFAAPGGRELAEKACSVRNCGAKILGDGLAHVG